MLEQGAQSDFADGPSVNSSAQAKDTHDERLRRAREGDGSAFSELVRDLQVPLCSYVARMVGNDELGRDLVQETLMRACTSLPELRADQHFKAWLYRIATNLARSHLRRARLIRWLPWTQTEEGASLTARSIAGPEVRASDADIALLLGISEKSVGSNICRAREQFP